MHKSINILLLFLLLVGTKTVYPQGNAVKFGLLGAPFGDFSFGIEQLIHSNYTMNVNFGYWNLKNSLIDIPHLFNEGKNIWLQSEGSGWHGSVEMRTYFSFDPAIEDKHFYWGPYFRLWNNKLLLGDYIQNDLVNNKQLFDVNTKIKGIGVGAQLGYQLMLTDRLWLDFYFIGLGVEHVKMNVEYKAVGVDSFEYGYIESDVNEAFSDRADFIKNKVKVWSDPESLFIELPATIPGIRVGINIAYTLD